MVTGKADTKYLREFEKASKTLQAYRIELATVSLTTYVMLIKVRKMELVCIPVTKWFICSKLNSGQLRGKVNFTMHLCSSENLYLQVSFSSFDLPR